MKRVIISDHYYKMVESDRSEAEKEDMDRLQLSSDSIEDTVLPKKRLRVEDSENETNLPARKRQISFSEQSRMVKNDNAETMSDKDNINGCNVKEERYILCPENEQTVQEISLSKLNVDRENKEKQDGKLNQETTKESSLDENNVTLNNIPGEINVKKEIVENKVIIKIYITIER